MGEAQRAVLKRYQEIRGTRDEWTTELHKELADVFIKLFEIAYREGVQLFDLFAKRWEEVRDRDFRANPTGHGLPKE